MRKLYILIIGIFLLTGCNGNVTINIDKNSIKETVKVSEPVQTKYNEIKQWSGFPIPLYYDQELKAPLWMPNREKESGVSYYNDKKDDTSKTIEVTGNFDLKNHNRSNLVRSCFKYYNVIQEGNKTIFSTSQGLICAFNNFDVVINTPYSVITNNATSVDTNTNTYTWKINNSNKKTTNIYLEIDFSKKYNSSSTEKSKNNNGNIEKNSDTIAKYIITVIIGVSLIIAAIVFLKKIKNNNIDNL